MKNKYIDKIKNIFMDNKSLIIDECKLREITNIKTGKIKGQCGNCNIFFEKTVNSILKRGALCYSCLLHKTKKNIKDTKRKLIGKDVFFHPKYKDYYCNINGDIYSINNGKLKNDNS